LRETVGNSTASGVGYLSGCGEAQSARHLAEEDGQ
jgi:hypothetical protein